MQWLSVAVLALVTLERLSELVISSRNMAALIARGGVEHAPGHYPLIVAVHVAWLAGLWFVAPWLTASWAWIVAYLAVEALRVWTIGTLGRRWTTRIVTVPGESLVVGGPYRFIRHPNYVVVALEILVLPMIFGLVWYALVFTALNAAVLWVRIRAEEEALRILR